MEEEVFYSEGEPFEGYLYPNNTWDSEDSTYEEEYKVSIIKMDMNTRMQTEK